MAAAHRRAYFWREERDRLFAESIIGSFEWHLSSGGVVGVCRWLTTHVAAAVSWRAAPCSLYHRWCNVAIMGCGFATFHLAIADKRAL
jgi:hypothetical protein